MDAWTTDEVVAKVESEGLGYTIEDGLAAERISDPALAALWKAADEALSAVRAYLDAQTAASETTASGSLQGPLTIDYTRLLCDSAPPLFKGLRHDEHGCQQLDSICGGTLRLNGKGGRFGDSPELYFKGDFGPTELLGWLRAIAPHSASHISQSFSFRDGSGIEHWVSFRAPDARLDGEPL